MVERKKSILGRITSGLKRELSTSRRPSLDTPRERRDSDTLSIRSVSSTTSQQLDSHEVDRLFPEAIRFIDERLHDAPFTNDQRLQIVKEYLRRSQQGPAQSLLILKRLRFDGDGNPPSKTVFAELRVLFRTEGVDWLRDFCKGRGFTSFGDAVVKGYPSDLVSDADFQNTVMSCIRAFTNNKFGLTIAKDDPNCYLMLMCLANCCADTETVQLALQILTIMCLMDPPQTHGRIVEAAMATRLLCKHDLCFTGLVQFAGSRQPTDSLFWVDYCIFMNAVVGTRDADEDVELRIHLRSLLFKQPARDRIEQVYTNTDNDILLRQLDFFYSLLETDRELMRERKQTLSDMLSVGELVEELADSTGGLIEPTLRLLHAAPLSSQPSLTLFLNSCLQEVVIQNAGIHADFSLLPAFRVDMSKYIANFEQSERERHEERAIELQRRLDHLQHQSHLAEVAFIDKVAKVKEEFEERQRAAGLEIGELHRRLQAAQEEAAQLRLEKMRLEREKFEEGTIDEFARRRSIEPPSVKEPIVKVVNIQEPTSPTMTAIQPSDMLPFKPDTKPLTVTSAPPPPPLPPMAGKPAPPPPPPMMTPSAPLLPTTTIKERPRKGPTSKMRPLQWKKIPDMKLAGTIWYTLDDLKWEPVVNLDLLQTRFGIRNAASTASATEETVMPSKCTFSFLSTKQSTNLEIALKQVKVPLREAAAHFLQMDDAVFDNSLVGELMKQDVSDQARQQAVGMPADSLWSTAEAFMVSLFRVPAYELRLRCFKLQGGFEEWSLGAVDCVRIAANKIINDDDFKKALEVILLVGNFMNYGTFRGNARGIEIDSLSLLPATRSIDSKSAVIHVLAEYLEKHVPSITAQEHPDLPVFKEASLTNFGNIREELKERRQELQYIEFTLQQYQPESPQDLLVKKALPFTSKARADLDTISNSLNQAQELYSKLCVLLYIDNKQDSHPQDLNPFAIVHQFMVDLQRAGQENRVRAAEAEARVAREQRAAANTARLQSNRIKAMLESADDRDRNMVDGLLVALR